MPSFEVTFKEFFPIMNDLRDCPDAHISVQESDRNPGTFIWFWPNVQSRRSEGKNSLIENQSYPQVIHGIVPKVYNNSLYCPKMLKPYVSQKRDRIDGGQWLISVLKAPDRWIGLLHSEDHYKDHHWDPNCDSVAYKSLDIAYSYDEGKSWESTFVPILSDEKNRMQKNLHVRIDRSWWGGPGDGVLVRFNNQLRIYWADSEGVKISASNDPYGVPGSWWYMGSVSGIMKGASPSLCFNPQYNMWVIVYHTWMTPRWTLRIAFSYDGMNWFEDRQIPNTESRLGGRAWMPTIIDKTDDVCGHAVRLYYSDCSEDSRGVCVERKFAVADAWIGTAPTHFHLPGMPRMTWVDETPWETIPTKSTISEIQPNSSATLAVGAGILGLGMIGLAAVLISKKRRNRDYSENL
jgi:hypothetical protein